MVDFKSFKVKFIFFCFFVVIFISIFQASAFKIALELINEEALSSGSKIQLSTDYKSKFWFFVVLILKY